MKMPSSRKLSGTRFGSAGKCKFKTHLNLIPITHKTPLSRQWRSAAQRNLRNQWMKLISHKQKWISASSAELCKKNLLSSYKDMVGVVASMINDSRSMRCFTKRSGASTLLQYSSHSEDDNSDPGDGGGIHIRWQKLGQELVQMFASELLLKRLIVVELLSLSCKEEQNDKLSWSNELYPEEFEDLRSSVLFCEDTRKPTSPRINGDGIDFLVPSESHIRADREVLHVYLTTWLVEVNIDTQRIGDIFITVGEEMHRSLS
ncbi:hypothetical protein ACHQM5_015261 [Ranunculus cassubicifolius]